MIARPRQVATAATMCGPNVKVLPLLVNDLWIRDTGPTFLVNDRGHLAGTVWRFNSWGEKYSNDVDDATLAGRLTDYLGHRKFQAPLVNEGGAISVDGDGTLLTTESVLLNENRNPGLSRSEVEALLCQFTGARKIIWLPGSSADRITDGHVDGLAVFARERLVIAEISDDPEDPEYAILQENVRALQLATDAKGRSLSVGTITRPPYNPKWSEDFAASYVNFYIANGAVIMPAFGHRRSDAAAKSVLAEAFPQRQIVALRIDAIAQGGGGIHCVTQQQPVP